MRRGIIAGISTILAALALLDGVFGGGERLWMVANYFYPPKPDPSYELRVLGLSYAPDKFEKTGKRSFGIGLSLYNTNSFTIYYEVVSADYSIEDFQNVSSSALLKGRVRSHKMEPVEFSPIYMGFTGDKVHKGEAHIAIKYGRNERRLGNMIKLNADLLYYPKGRSGEQFSYALHSDSTLDVRSTMP